MLDATGRYMCEKNANSRFNCYYEKKPIAGTVPEPISRLDGYVLKIQTPYTSSSLEACADNTISTGAYKNSCAM